MKHSFQYGLLTFLSLLADVPCARAQGSAPVITVHPTNRVVALGATAIFSVIATGAPPLSYRWFKDGAALEARTSPSLVLSNVTAADEGFYFAEVSNAYGVATSRTAHLSLNTSPPVITTHPGDRALFFGGNVTFSVTANGALPFFYRWLKDGALMPNRTSRTLVLSSLTPADAGFYSAIVSNSFGSVTSRPASLTITGAPPSLYLPMTNVLLCCGSAGAGATLWVSVFGSPPLYYQWRFNGADLPGQNANSISIPSDPANAGDYSVMVTNNYGAATSSVATVELGPRITEQPRNQTVLAGGQTYFYIRLDACQPRYQWRLNEASLADQTNYFLRIDSATVADVGDYTVVVTDSWRSVTSAVAHISLYGLAPAITRQPVDLIDFYWGTNIYFGVEYIAAEPPRFQWRFKDANLSGETNQFLVLPASPDRQGGYSVVLSNSFGSVTSRVATFRFRADVLIPTIATHGQPQGRALCPQTNEVFLYVYMANPPTTSLFSQWRKDGADLPGATDRSLRLDGVPADAGDYTVVITNSFGAVTSEVATVSLVPAIVRQPDDLMEIPDGNDAYFNVDAASCAPLEYQWQRNGLNLPAATNQAFRFSPATLTDAGDYRIIVRNTFGAVTSRVARLTVIQFPPEIEPALPYNGIVDAGQDTYFYVYYSAAPPPLFQWRFNGVDLPGETNENLQFVAASANQAGGYSVVLSNAVGVATSRVAQLIVIVGPPVILTQPADLSVFAGRLVNFFVYARGAPPPTYQWRFNGADIPGATNDYLSFTAGFTNQQGGYSVVASNEYGSVTSRVATLDITLLPPVFALQPRGLTVVEGAGATFYGTLLNNVPAYFQWQFNGADLPGATNNVLSLANVNTNDSGGYRLIAWNDAGRATSAVATLIVRLPDALDHWRWRHPFPQGNDLYGVTHDGTRFLSVGDTGAIVTSTKGVDWVDSHGVHDGKSRFEVTAGNGVFVSLYSGGLQASTNGINWSSVGPETPLYMVSVAYGAGRFVALGQTAQGTSAVISTNGWDWETLSSFTPFWPVKVAYAGELFLAICKYPNDAGGNRFFASSDGTGWVPGSNPTAGGAFSDFAFGGGVYVGVSSLQGGYVALSSNGVVWVSQRIVAPSALSPSALAYGAGRFVAVGTLYGAASVASSTDGLNWTPIPGVATNGLLDVTFAAGRFVAVGLYGAIATSTDGVNWIDVNGGSDRNFRDIARGGGLYVAVGNGGLLFTSPDGTAWTARASGTSNNLRGATFFKDRFVVVGANDDPTAGILTSTDGATWSRLLAPASLFGVAHNDERLVAVGNNGEVVTSLDGLSWSNIFNFSNPNPVGSIDLNAVTWGGGRFVAVGRAGAVLVSSNGLNWASASFASRNLHGVAYGNGVYVAVARHGELAFSTNVTNWRTLALDTTDDISDVAFGGGQFIAVGQDGLMFTSTNGLDWLRRITPSEHDLRAVIYAEGSFHIAGDNETLLQSGQIAPALRITRRASDGAVLLEIFAEAGRVCLLQGSSDLSHWRDLATFIGSNQPNPYITSATAQWQFYRVVCF